MKGSFLFPEWFTNLPAQIKNTLRVLSSFDCLYLFENQQIYILEIKCNDLPAGATKSEMYRWLMLDKDTLSITRFVYLALNSSDLAQERFFREGYLSFDSDQAIFIRESSSVQMPLDVREKDQLRPEVKAVIQQWLSEIGGA